MFANDKEIFIQELEDYLRKTAKCAERSIKIYLNRIRRLLDSGYSVNDLCGHADPLWESYGPKGQRYDPKDHGNTRAAIKHVAALVREKLLKESGCPYVSYEKGWSSFRPKGRHENGYVIENGVITFSYNIGFRRGKDVAKVISATNIRKLTNIFERARKHGCLVSSGTCINTIHGPLCKFDYTFADVSGKDCGRLFDGNSAYAEQLDKEYQDLIDTLRT